MLIFEDLILISEKRRISYLYKEFQSKQPDFPNESKYADMQKLVCKHNWIFFVSHFLVCDTKLY